MKHGANKAKRSCIVEGCQKWPVRGGVCASHGAKRVNKTGKRAARPDAVISSTDTSGPGRKRAKVSFDSLGGGVDQSILTVGSRVLVTYKGSLFKATIRKRRYENNQHDFLIHYDGNKKTNVHWIPLDRINDILENDNSDLEQPLSTKKKRKRGQQFSSEDSEEESDERQNSRKKTAARKGCSAEGCRNPIAGCPAFAQMGVCWYHGENET